MSSRATRRVLAGMLLSVLACSSRQGAETADAAPPGDARARLDAPSDAVHRRDASRDARPTDAPDFPACPAISSAPDSSSQLAAEAGFIDLPPQSTAARYAARMFYSFHPADSDPPSKPLFVAWNGGPGSATTLGLLSYGTGPETLDWQAADGAPPVTNAASFTALGNILYLDERQTGFSYGLRGDAALDTSCKYSELDDGVDFTRAIISFLDSHPALAASRVILLAESYGGTRAESVLHVLYDYASDPGIPAATRDSIQCHLEAVLPGASGAVIPVDRIATQFGTLVLIEPLLFGGPQYVAQMNLMPEDPYIGPLLGEMGSALDSYDLQEPNGWSNGLTARAFRAFASADAGAALLGVDLSSVSGLTPDARANGFRVPWATTSSATEAALASQLGALAPGDSYLASGAYTCATGNGGLNPPEFLQDVIAPDWFLAEEIYYVDTFITHARYDGAIYAPAIPWVLAHDAKLPVTVDTSSDGGEARPGWIRVSLPGDDGLPAKRISIRFPEYTTSGHMVAVTQGADLLADVRAWLNGE